MIISHTHRFLFLKSLKTAGTSVEAALSQSCSGDDVVTPLNDFKHNRDETGGLVHHAMNAEKLTWWDKEAIGQHVDALTMKNNLADSVWNGYYKFSIVRNPWDRMVSMFTWLNRNNPRTRPQKRMYHYLGIPFNEMTEIKKLFREFVRNGIETNDRFYFIDGNLCVNFVIHYEKLTEDLGRLRQELKLPEMTLPRLKTGIRPGKHHYSEYYDEETKELVARVHQKDIETFGYHFETA